MTTNRIIAEDVSRITAAPLPWDEFSGRTVLITGGAGFLASYLVRTLLHLNRTRLSSPATVAILVRDPAAAATKFDSDPNLHILRGDLSLQPSLLADYIIHAASQASPRFYRADPVGTLFPNTIGTAHLLDLARLSNTRSFLFFSSGEAALPLSPLDPRACYGESKRMGETMCAAWCRQHKVPAKIVRISHTYGPGMKLDDGRVFADFTRDILGGGPIVLHSDGSARRPFLYLADATVAFFTVLLQGIPLTIYNVANPLTFMTIRELAERLGKEFGLEVAYRDRAAASDYVPSTNPDSLPDIADLVNLGWTPTTGVEEGFRRTVASYSEEEICA